MRTTWACLLSFLAFAAALAPAIAQDLVRVEVRVTFSSGDSVYLDKGRSSGLDVGDVVELEDPTRGRLKAELTVVSTTTARAVMLGEQVPPEPGVRGEVLLPAERVKAATESADPGTEEEGAKPPEHPPWEREEEPRDPDQPLLTPSFHTPREEREAEWRGRIWTHLLLNNDREGGSSRYFLGRMGTDLTGTNQFGLGGLLRIRFEGEQRKIDVDGGRSRSDSDFRIDRLSYEWGGGYDSKVLVKIGRFLPRDTAELGLLDGVEATFDVGFGRIGVGLGAFPEPMPDRKSFKDLGATLSWRYASGENEQFVGLVAYQQTWHEGDKDRSLVLTRMSWVPNREFSFFGSAWIDHYDSGDEIKDSGFELTQLNLNAGWRFHPDHRARIGFSHLRWPEIDRNEFSTIAPEFLRDNKVNRFDLSTNHDLADFLRLDTRIGRWSDQDDDGLTGHVTLRFPNVVADGLTLSVTGFRTEGSTSQGNGVRIMARHDLPGVYLSLGYELTDREITRIGYENEKLTQHAILATVDFAVGRAWSFSVNGDYRFGDAQDSVSLGVFIQYRF